MSRNSCANAFVISTLALGSLFAAQAQEVDADALMETLNAEIKKVDGKKKDAAPQKVSSSEKDGAEESSEETTQTEAGPREAKAPNEAVVTAVGKGETKEEAKLAAFRAAVEKAVGIYVDAESLMENSELIKDRVNTISNADIQKYKTLKESRMKSGMYFCQIKAWVEKKAIAPKFADMFPEAFANVSEAAETIHVQKVTRAKRSADAASLMAGALKNVDRMRNWVRLSVAKGKGLEEVTKIKQCVGQDLDVAEVPGKGLYSVRYSMKIDKDAYFKGFVPHFKQTLEKMQEGEAEDGVVLEVSSYPGDRENGHGKTIEIDGQKLLQAEVGTYEASGDLRPFVKGYGKVGHTYFVDPLVLSGFPGMSENERGKAWNCALGASGFMFDGEKGLSKINERRSYHIWLLDGMNKSMTSIRCSAYKLPADAVRAYWKSLYGELNVGLGYDWESQKMQGKTVDELKKHERVEIVLLDADGEEIMAKMDNVPAMLLSSGLDYKKDRRGGLVGDPREVRSVWNALNAPDSFFVRPMFVRGTGSYGGDAIVYSSEIQRDVYFPLTDAQLAEVKQVKVRFVGGRKAK